MKASLRANAKQSRWNTRGSNGIATAPLGPRNDISIIEEAIDISGVLASVTSVKAGAVVPFIGMVRKEGDLSGLFYECHPEMSQRVLENICTDAERKWPVEKISVCHRVGWVPVGEASIVIAVSSPHRREAFEACRFVIEEIKKEAPIWKKGKENEQNI